jgi:hypothetical protein
MSDATAPTEAPAAPPDAEPSKSARQAILDALLDTVEAGPQTRQQLLDAMPEVDPNAIDQALHRLVEAGDALRVDRGLYKLAPPKPKAPPPPPVLASDGRPYEDWLRDLWSWYANPASWDVEKLGPPPQDPKHKIPGTVMLMFSKRVNERVAAAEKAAAEKAEQAAQAAEEAATTPPLAVSPADVDLFRKLLEACNGRVATNQPPGNGIKNLDVIKSMLANGADLDQDILPVLRRHADELARRPLESWAAPWFVAEVAQSHRQRIAAAQKPAAAAIGDEELVTKLLDAAGGNVMTGNTYDIYDLASIRAMLASGVTIDDILSTLRAKVDHRVTKYAATLASWGEPRFLRHVAETHLRRTVVPTLVEKWSKAAPGTAVQTPAVSEQGAEVRLTRFFS